MSFDHILINVPTDKFEPLIDWCKAAFGHLGLVEISRPLEWVVGLGPQPKPWLWFAQMSMEGLDTKTVNVLFEKQHVAVVGTVEQIKEFHRAAIAAGGIDNGAPAPRAYTPTYYAAFVRDPVCNINFEVCCTTFKEGDDN